MTLKIGDKVEYTGTSNPRLTGATGVITTLGTISVLVEWDGQFSVYNTVPIQKGSLTLMENHEFKVGDKVIYIGKQTYMLIGATGTITSNIHSETVNITWDESYLNGAFSNVQIKKSNLQLYVTRKTAEATIKDQYVARKTLHMSMGRCTNDYL